MDIFIYVQNLVDYLTFDLFRLQHDVLGGAVNFFIFDSIKILILLIGIIFIVAMLRSYLPPEKIKKFLVNRFKIIGNILAALIGIVTPFCSCSAVPLFIGLVESGVPLGVTFSYLISAPMVNEVAIVILYGLFGAKITAIYILSGVLIAIIAGWILGTMHLEKYVEDYVWKIKVKNDNLNFDKSFFQRVKEAINYTLDLVSNVYPYVLIGVGIGAFIHGYAPANFLSIYAGRNNPFAVPLAVVIGVPLYSNAAGIIPVIKSLIDKGLPLGTALAFMMSVTALSFPEMIILRKVLKPKLLGLFIGIVSLGILFTGYLFNLIIQ